MLHTYYPTFLKLIMCTGRFDTLNTSELRYYTVIKIYKN